MYFIRFIVGIRHCI